MDMDLVDHSDPATIVQAIVEHDIDVVVSDMQVGSMGGMAIVRHIRGASSFDGLRPVPVVLLLDRSADAFLAKRAAAAAWVQKPLTSRALSAAVGDALRTVADDVDDVDAQRAIPTAELGTAVVAQDTEPEPAA